MIAIEKGLSYVQVMDKEKKKITFRVLAEKASRIFGSSLAFFVALCFIFLWAISGFYFKFDDTWQLIINTATTIGTFVMVILVQNTQTREARSMQLKLDELLYGTKNTRDSLVKIEDESDAEIERFHKEFKKLREDYMAHRKRNHE